MILWQHILFYWFCETRTRRIVELYSGKNLYPPSRVMVLAVTYVLSLSLFFFCVRVLLIDYHYHSSSSWLLLSVTYVFTSLHLSCAHHLLLVHHFIQYIRGSHSPTTHHIFIADWCSTTNMSLIDMDSLSMRSIDDYIYPLFPINRASIFSTNTSSDPGR
jgi:hypothetical protein